jgi:16S rRNA (guanine527-N7)-methyltransferase
MTSSSSFETRLNSILITAGQEPLDSTTAARFESYCSLLLRWNARTNLTAIRDEDGILRRHFVESIAAARSLPLSSGSFLDFGSGAGFPGIPVALCQPGLQVTLAESQGKKAAFLREAVRVLGLSTKVHSGRAEVMGETFDIVTLRAVDRMEAAVQAAVSLVSPGGWLVLLTTTGSQAATQAAAGPDFSWSSLTPLPGGENRALLPGQKSS